jgi:hypothetical protein
MKRVSGCITHTIVTGTLVLWIGTAAAVISCLGPVGINAPGRGTITETELSDSLSETGEQEEVDESGFIVLDPPVENHVQWKAKMTMINDLGKKATDANPMKFLVPVAEDVVIELDARGTGNNPGISRENVVVYIKGVSGHAGTFQLKSSAPGNLLTAGNKRQLIIKDLILRGHDANNKALVDIVGGKLDMKSGSEITGNYNTDTTAADTGGGVHAESLCTLTMSGDAKIHGNQSARCGGGVHIGSNSTMIMNDYASIYNNESLSRGMYPADYGGGISGMHVSITMNGHASIYGNTAERGGGVRINHVLVMNDNASVYGNTAVIEGGGVLRGGSLTMNDNASVSGNTAPSYANIK